MKEFLQILRRFVPPYKKYLVWSVVFNILSALLNIFSFAALIPLLQILFKVNTGAKATHVMALSDGSLKDVLANNADYYTQMFIADWGPTTTLLIIGLIMGFMTFLKTGAYFLSSASIIPVRTGVVCDIRNQLYKKITSLSLSFFSEERKGDIIARMSGDVQEVDSSVMSSLDLLFKNPILVLIYFITLMVISWQLTIFTLLFVPLFASFMGIVGRKLKQSTSPLERYDESGRRDFGRFAHHQGFLCRGYNEPKVSESKLYVPQRHNAREHSTADGAPHERVSWHHYDYRCAVVWRYARIRRVSRHKRSNLYLLSCYSV